MGVLTRLSELFTPPTVDVSTRRCADCGAAVDAGTVDADADVCPDCGGELRESETVETVPRYWGM